MKKRMMTVVLALLVFGVSVAGAKAEKPAKTPKSTKTPAVTQPQVKTFKGTVKVTKDKDGKITDAKIGSGPLSRTYTVALDKQGTELADKMAGKKVVVKGFLQKNKSGRTLLTVNEFSAVVAKPAKKVSAEKATKPAEPKTKKPAATKTTKVKSTTKPAKR